MVYLYIVVFACLSCLSILHCLPLGVYNLMKNVIPTLRYIWLTIKHKTFVFRAGLLTKAPLWRLLIHDWTKFTPAEAPHYGRQFFGAADDPEGFIRAWIHHQNHNPHHWEYWIPRTGHSRCNPPFPDNCAVDMPLWACREMVADWLGASRAYEGRWPTAQSWPWLEQNLYKVRVTSRTRLRINTILIQALGSEASRLSAYWYA